MLESKVVFQKGWSTLEFASYMNELHDQIIKNHRLGKTLSEIFSEGILEDEVANVSQEVIQPMIDKSAYS